jgi:hypothetical protein
MDQERRKGPMDAEQAARMLGRLMLSWDGQWFLKVAQSCGLEKAVELNARVRESFGRIEMRELMRAEGVESVRDLAHAVSLLKDYQRVFLGEGMLADPVIEGKCVRVGVTRCRPQEGAGKAGLRPDTPCVACERLWNTWLESLLPGTQWETEIRSSLGRGAPACEIWVRRTA